MTRQLGVDIDLFQSDIFHAQVEGARRGVLFQEREFLYDRLAAIGIRPRTSDLQLLHGALRGAEATDSIVSKFLGPRRLR